MPPRPKRPRPWPRVVAVRAAANVAANVAAIVAASGAAVAPVHAQSAATGSVVGVVYDSLARAPLGGAAVQLATEPGNPAPRVHNVRADDAGRFRVGGVLPGVYLVAFGHPTLDSLGLEAPLRRVTVAAGAPTSLALGIPRPRQIVRALCAGVASADSAALLLGHVRDAATRAPRGGAVLSLAWTEVTIRARAVEQTRPTIAVPANAGGWFAVCDVPAGVELLARAAAGADTSGWVTVEVPAGGVLRRDFYVGPSEAREETPRADTADVLRARTGPARLRGVVRDGAGAPVAGARVRVWGSPAEGVTNAEGAFALASLPAGSQTVDVRALGYLPARLAVDLLVADSSAAAPNEVAVPLLAVRQFLDTVQVLASVAWARDGTGFERRRRAGRGAFLTRADIERRPATDFTNVLATVHGVDVRDELDPRTHLQHRTVYLRSSAGARCRATVFIDGMRVEPDDLDAFLWTSEVDALEVYDRAGRVPAQYQNTPDCGVILVWTERLRPRRGRAAR